MNRPTTDRHWEDYLEALRTFTEAPHRATTKRAQITQTAAQATRGAEEALRAAAERRGQLERRIQEVDGLFHRVRVEQDIPAEGTVAPVTIGVPASAREALTTIDDLERVLRADAERLRDARHATPPSQPAIRPNGPILLGATVIAATILLIILAILEAL